MKLVLVLLALLYTLIPYDLLPDVLAGWGWLDDLAIWGFLLRYLYKRGRGAGARTFYNRTAAGGTGDRQRPGDRNEDRRGEAFNGTGGTDDPYGVLGLRPGSSQQEIRRAYRELAGKYHPDKVSHLGDEFKALAEERFKQIQEAYEKLRVK